MDSTGAEQHAALALSWNIPFERAMAVRTFPSYRGQKNFPGLWWSATTGEHVGYESWVERDVLMMMDFDPDIVAFAAQPFWLIWLQEDRVRRHAPDYFARTVDGQGLVVDVRPDDRIDLAAAESFTAMARACAEVGWEFRRTGGPSPELRANVHWLAGYRHPRCFQEDIAEQLLEVFASPAPLLRGAQKVGDRLAVLPVLYHLLWSGRLTADLASAVLGPVTEISAREVR
ncbi:TnsA-like heteromeric transposase endonuclease subunit [Microtetraspora sp. NBRC 13810]|uniref:TnsA-like heteromeric transposase endonuclease subunit n=1 Tax=Microtetraspora sp. NBRC 13810 TaxID=3030990 RepID=UPI002554B33A|nr:TnsA-like heteromeric transposase endonuclease subunit [Microtetraspora sp. NBRC 13810]